MARYHYNPSTGEPGYCRAKPGNCPFLAQGSVHFDTKEGARRGYEEFEENGFQSLTAQLMVNQARVQREIISRFSGPDSEGWNDPKFRELIDERDSISRAILKGDYRELLHAPRPRSAVPQRLIHEPVGSDRGDTIVGIGNRQESLGEVAPQTAKAMIELSEEWLSSLSSEEAHAVLTYSSTPDSANGNGAIISQAVLKAPPLEPTRVYSGLSVHVGRDVLRQYESGRIELGYPISTTLNPAQVNGFMGMYDEDSVKQKAVVLEIDTTVGAAMEAATQSPHEFEVLLPAGSYEVVSVRENVEFLWDEGGYGRDAELLIKVRRLED